MITEEQTEQIREQILKQIEENFPEDKKQPAIEQIKSMNSEQIENFVKQNQISSEEGNKCIFCSILSKEVKSYKIGENEKAVAVLEINPISEAHSLIIPKEHSDDIELSEIKNLAEEISEKIKSKFKAKQIKIFVSELFGHKIINLLPVYKNETPNSKRKKENSEELEDIKKIFEEIPKKKAKKKTEAKSDSKKEIEKEEKLRLPRRIP